MSGIQFRREEVAFHKCLHGIEGYAWQKGDVFEGGKDVCGCCLDF